MSNGRVKDLVEGLEKTILEFMREHRVTHHEYRAAINLLVETVKAGEKSLLYDVFFEAEATDIGNIGREGSPEAIEGPFFLPRCRTPAQSALRVDTKARRGGRDPLFQRTRFRRLP